MQQDVHNVVGSAVLPPSVAPWCDRHIVGYLGQSECSHTALVLMKPASLCIILQ